MKALFTLQEPKSHTEVISLLLDAGSTGLLRALAGCRCFGKENAEVKINANNGTMNSVLVVEDSVPFRRFVSTLLREKTHFQVVSEASDGLKAVRRATELNPHLILMDIGLPGLNGIEAARRIRELAPRSRIVFLTQESSTEVVEEALSSGALGYVHKPRAGNDLFPAVTAALEGKQFISNGLLGEKYRVEW